jgi:hypothetical protein
MSQPLMRLLRCPNPYCVTVYAQPFMLRPFLCSILNVQPFKLLQRAINNLLPTDKWVTVDGKLGRQTLVATKTFEISIKVVRPQRGALSCHRAG